MPKAKVKKHGFIMRIFMLRILYDIKIFFVINSL